MDGFYRGIETSLLVFSLILGLGAFALSSGSMASRAETGIAGTRLAVTLPMLTVTADN